MMRTDSTALPWYTFLSVFVLVTAVIVDKVAAFLSMF